MYKQFILLKLLVSTSIALAGFAWAAGSPLKQVKGAADLQEVKGANFSQTYVKPGVDFSFYNKIFVGEATLGLEFLDRPTREVLARVVERGVIGGAANQSNGISRPANRETVIEDVRLWATNAAIKLRNTLDTALKD